MTPVVQAPADDLFAAVSPDGRWLAYESNATGRRNVVVRPFPRTGDGQWQVTTDGGRQPSWSRDGRELFFLGANGGLHRTRVLDASGAFRIGAAEMLSPPRYYGALSGPLVARTYDVAADGQRFMLLKSTGDGPSAQAQTSTWCSTGGRACDDANPRRRESARPGAFDPMRAITPASAPDSPHAYERNP